MAAPELGQKQICPSCSAKFYDLNKRPALCPKCQTAFDPEEALRNRRIRTRVPDYEADEEKEEKVVEEVEGFEEEADETPELDKAVEAEPLETDEDVEDPVAAWRRRRGHRGRLRRGRRDRGRGRRRGALPRG